MRKPVGHLHLHFIIMLKVILTKGLPASGKSTWAKQLLAENPNTYKRINKDDLRAMLDNSKHSQDAEKFVLRVRDALILLALSEGKHVVIDDTNLAQKHETRIKQLVRGKAEVIIQDFTDVPLETCIYRDRMRQASVGEKVIRQMYKQFLQPPVKKVEIVEGLPHVIICDLDGTLALFNGRNPYDASTCANDILNPVVAQLLRGRKVILASGREEKYREPTLIFLKKHDIEYIDLFMRPTDDKRRDAVVKQEIFDAHIRGKYNIDFVLDDRNQVVEMWRELGLVCLQVAEGDF